MLIDRAMLLAKVAIEANVMRGWNVYSDDSKKVAGGILGGILSLNFYEKRECGFGRYGVGDRKGRW